MCQSFTFFRLTSNNGINIQFSRRGFRKKKDADPDPNTPKTTKDRVTQTYDTIKGRKRKRDDEYSRET